MKHLKKLVALLVCAMTLTSISAMAIDLQDADIVMKATSSPLDGCSISFNLNTSNGYATYSATTTGDGTVTRAKVTMVLQKRVDGVWTNVSDEYVDDQPDRIASVSGRQYVAKGYYYRVESVNKVWVGSKTYTETHHSELKYY